MKNGKAIHKTGGVQRSVQRFVQRCMATLLVGGIVFAVTSFVGVSDSTAQSQTLSIRSAIDTVQQATGYRFLYRDALVAGRTVALPSTGDLLTALVDALEQQGLVVHVDTTRQQVLITDTRASNPANTLTGQVVDHTTGARLPHATVLWHNGEAQRGVAANEDGVFRISLKGRRTTRDTVTLRISYVGYQSTQVHIDLQAPPSDLTVRLSPEPAMVPEVVVSSIPHRSSLDTTWQTLVQPALTTPFGEASVIRALQPLPAVGVTGALANGLNVRGSRADGFHVLLDGMPIYNSAHLFGAFDAFHPEALQRVGLFYDVAPADLPSPPGGTLALTTHTGAQTRWRATAGASNTAVRGLIEGPLDGGRSSVLVAGRRAYLNTMSWLGSEALIAQGLDLNPSTSPLPDNAVDLGERLVTAGPPTAHFHDVHGKVYHETLSGQRITLSTYLGGDQTRQTGERLTFNAEAPRLRDRLAWEPVETKNRWGNEAASLQIGQPWGERAYSHTLLAVSRYYSDFQKDDFVYTRLERPANGLRTFTAPFKHQNELIEWRLDQRVDLAPNHPGLWTLGGTLHRYRVNYAETSALRPEFGETRRSLRFDLFAQYDWTDASWTNMHLGLRTHYFSLGRYVRLSPRLKVRLFPSATVSLHAGYSRNHQFVHRLTLPSAGSADVWVTSNEANAPSRANHFSGGVQFTPTSTTAFQADAYVKTYANVWQHETETALRQTETSILFDPWSTDHDAFARGLELMHKQRWGPLYWTNSYTLSKVELQNDALNGGRRFPADWDRRHQFTTQVQATHDPWAGVLTWFYATGTPSPWALQLDTEPERLDAYHRLDASLRYQRALGGATLEATASIFNLYDRANPWYRDPVAVLTRNRPSRLSYRIVDVYDLGLQPSFNLTVRF